MLPRVSISATGPRRATFLFPASSPPGHTLRRGLPRKKPYGYRSFLIPFAELFADNGETVMTEIFFPSEDFDRVKLFAEGGKARLIKEGSSIKKHLAIAVIGHETTLFPLHFSVSLSAIILLLQKENEKSTSDLLLGTWTISELKEDLNNDGDFNDNNEDQLNSCVGDNVLTFHSGGELIINQGALKCDPNEEPSLTGTWFVFR